MIEQRDGAWVRSASPDAIVAAQNAGELAHYMGGLTAEQRDSARSVDSARDRVLAAAYGLVSLRGRGDVTSDFFAAKRARMDSARLEKLSWVEGAPAGEVYAAECSGELDHLMGRGPVPAVPGSGGVL